LSRKRYSMPHETNEATIEGSHALRGTHAPRGFFPTSLRSFVVSASICPTRSTGGYQREDRLAVPAADRLDLLSRDELLQYHEELGMARLDPVDRGTGKVEGERQRGVRVKGGDQGLIHLLIDSLRFFGVDPGREISM
jgi:hypothetical protein